MPRCVSRLVVVFGLTAALAAGIASGRTHRTEPAGSPAAGGPTLVLELADELRLTPSQREEVEDLEEEYRRRQLSEEQTERRLRAVLSDYQAMRYERLRSLRTN